MKILVVSDSHGQTEDLLRLKEKYAGKVDAMIHCGDSELDSSDPLLEGFISVKGNCDFGGGFPNYIVKEIGGYRILVTHGHLYNVGINLNSLSYKSEEEQANIALFGHTHKPVSGIGRDGVLYVNPGSISLPRGREERTYCILGLSQGEITVDFYEHDGTPVKSLTDTYQMA